MVAMSKQSQQQNHFNKLNARNIDAPNVRSIFVATESAAAAAAETANKKTLDAKLSKR